MAQSADYPDDYAAAEIVRKKIKDIVVDEKRFERFCDKYGIKRKQYEECKEVIDAYNERNWDVVPYDIVLLTSKKMEADFRE